MKYEDLAQYVEDDIIGQGYEFQETWNLGTNNSPYSFVDFNKFAVCVKGVGGEYFSVPLDEFDFTPIGKAWTPVSGVIFQIPSDNEFTPPVQYKVVDGLICELS